MNSIESKKERSNLVDPMNRLVLWLCRGLSTLEVDGLKPVEGQKQ